jgi:hypothetical protein
MMGGGTWLLSPSPRPIPLGVSVHILHVWPPSSGHIRIFKTSDLLFWLFTLSSMRGETKGFQCPNLRERERERERESFIRNYGP